MTISSQNRKAGPYVGDGSATSFPFSFKVFQASDLLVVRLDVATSAESTLTLGTDYSVNLNANQNANPGGTIALLSPLALGFNLVISSVIGYLQPTDLTNQGGFHPAVITNSLDRLTILSQQLKEQVDRSAKLPITSTADANTLVANINALADSLPQIQTVAGIETDVVTVAGIASDIPTVAANVTDITNFADVYLGPKTSDPATRNDGSTLQSGDLYFNTVSSVMRVYSGLSWGDVAQGTSTPYEVFSGTGAQTAFTLSGTPGSLGSLEGYISGVRQTPGVHYTVSGATATFTSAPPLGTNNIFFRWISTQPISVPSAGSVTTASLAPQVANGLTTVVLDPTADYVVIADASDSGNVKKALISVAGSKAQDFRLTLTSGTPVTTSDVTAAGTIYACPYKGNQISLYSGGTWNTRTSAQFSIALSALTSGRPYDVFCYDNAGTPTLEVLAWTSDTARATALAYQDGLLVKSGDATRRYLGTFYTTGAATTEDSVANRYLWNYYHRTVRPMKRFEPTASWTYTTSTFRQANNSVANQLNYVCGVAEDSVEARVDGLFSNSVAGNYCGVGIGIDSTTVNSGSFAYQQIGGSGYVAACGSSYRGIPGVGRHYIAWLEWSVAAGTTTFYGTNLPNISGLFGTVTA